jgi:hypothetical protein
VVVRVARRTFLLPAQRLPLTALPHREPVPGSAQLRAQNLEQHGNHILRGSPRRQRRGNGSISQTADLRTPSCSPFKRETLQGAHAWPDEAT